MQFQLRGAAFDQRPLCRDQLTFKILHFFQTGHGILIDPAQLREFKLQRLHGLQLLSGGGKLRTFFPQNLKLLFHPLLFRHQLGIKSLFLTQRAFQLIQFHQAQFDPLQLGFTGTGGRHFGAVFLIFPLKSGKIAFQRLIFFL